MSLQIVQLGSTGFKIIVNVKDSAGAARNLTNATNLKIKLKSALSNTGKEYPAIFEGDPSTGALSCVVAANDINTLGTWKAQAYYELGSWKGHSHPEEAFTVEGNLT